MADNPITVNLPADLPEDWVENQIVAPEGQSVGLSQQHGYNYLMEQVNNAQTAANEIGAAFAGLAPGGFGLGTVAVNISDLNDATKNGWYMNGAGGEAVHAPDNVPGWLVLVCAYADEIVFQTAYRYGSDEGRGDGGRVPLVVGVRNPVQHGLKDVLIGLLRKIDQLIFTSTEVCSLPYTVFTVKDADRVFPATE